MALVAVAVLAAPAQAQDEGPALLGDAVTIDIGGRVQTQYATTTVDGEPPGELFLRRARLEVEARVNEVVSGRFQADIAGGEPYYRDAYLQLDFSPALAVRAGHAYRPFGLLENTSSVRILPIERGLRIAGLSAFDEYAVLSELGYSNRDVGLQVLGAPEAAPLGLTYQAGVFAGPIHGETGDEEMWQVAARATVSPAERVRVGAGWSSRGFARPGLEDDFDLERGHAFEVDLEYGAFAPGFHLLAEVAAGDFDPFAAEDFFGAHAWLGYRTGSVGILSTIEPILRLSYADVDRVSGVDGLGGTLVTPGINLYFGGYNRLMVNYDAWFADGDADDQGSFKTQFQLVF